jgi:uncharacterized protein
LLKKIATISALSATAVLCLAAPAQAANGPFGFEPIPGSAYDNASSDWSLPYIVPEDFTQTMVSDETVLDVYPGTTDKREMNTQNETGPQAGRYLYSPYEVGKNGAVVVTDLRTGESKVIAQRSDWGSLDGIRWTPWGTLLVAEESAGGRVYELSLDPKDRTSVTAIEERGQLGTLRHEGVDIAPDGSVYVIHELNGGSVYKFVPEKRGDLSKGQLYALKLTGLPDQAQLWNQETYSEKVGAFEWAALDMEQVTVDADIAANNVSATEFGRPEDVEIIGQTLYVANTSEDRVIAVDLSKQTVSSYVQAGVNVPVEDQAAHVTGLNNPDNLAEGPDGALWVVEDNNFSDIYRADGDKDHDGQADSVQLFASLVDPAAETTGIYFGKNPKEMFVNIQHPSKPLADGTWKISRR